MENPDAGLIAKAVVGRLVSKRLQSLERLCMEAVLKDKGFGPKFHILSPVLLEVFMNFLVDEEARGRRDGFSLPVPFLKSLLNENLRTFSSALLNNINNVTMSEVLHLLTSRCGLLKTLLLPFGGVRIPASTVMGALEFFPDLQELRIQSAGALTCDQVERLPDLVPRLRILEIWVKTMDSCCQQRLCLLTNLEELYLLPSKGGVLGPNSDMWVACLEKLPKLQVLSSEMQQRGFKYTDQDPCLAYALSKLHKRGLNQPLQLRHLCISREITSGVTLPPLHLLPHITSLAVDAFENEPKKLLREAEVLLLVKHYGAQLTHLLVVCNILNFNVYSVVSHCPRLEELWVYSHSPDWLYAPHGYSYRPTVLPKGHFSRLRRLHFHVYLGPVPVTSNLIQRALESPNLVYLDILRDEEELEVNNEISDALFKTLSDPDNKGLFKNLRVFNSELDVTESNAASLGVAVKTVIASSPSLMNVQLSTLCGKSRGSSKLFHDLRLAEFCAQIPGLQALIF